MPAAASDMVNPSAWLLVNTSAPSPGAQGRPLADRTHMRGSRGETVSRSEAVAGNQRTGASKAGEEQPVDLSPRRVRRRSGLPRAEKGCVHLRSLGVFSRRQA